MGLKASKVAPESLYLKCTMIPFANQLKTHKFLYRRYSKQPQMVRAAFALPSGALFYAPDVPTFEDKIIQDPVIMTPYVSLI